MKVLHLPYNVGSQISVTVRGLRSIGIDARGMVLPALGDFIHSHDDVEVLPEAPELPRRLRWARQHAVRYGRLLGAIRWADILHWHFGSLLLRGGAELRWARLLRKPGVAEFWGSDIRVAEIEADDNPNFAAYAPREYLARQTPLHSLETQLPFARAGFACLVSHAAMLRHVRTDLWARVYLVRQRVLLSEYVPRPPDPRRSRPLIVHSPSNPELKGTRFVLAAVEKLRRKYDFTFRLVHGIPRREALAIMSEADVFVDQVITGTHGLATLEAMAFAKPVVCYIKPSMVGEYPQELPIVGANPETLEATLDDLIGDGERRRSLGLAGRAYVERYHDARTLSAELENIYRSLLSQRNGFLAR
ncbi:MAG: glycosyltransferase [Gemmatimonadales bacterium]